MGERGRPFGGGACFPGPCSPIVPLAAPSRWLTVLPSSSPRHCGYSTPSLVTRRRRRVTYFAFPFGGRANGRVYRQCRQRPQRPREPCTVRLRRRQCYAHSHCQQRVRKRAAAARRTLAGCVDGCVCAAGCRTPHARLTPASCVCGRRLPPRSRRHCLRGRACRAKDRRVLSSVVARCVCL